VGTVEELAAVLERLRLELHQENGGLSHGEDPLKSCSGKKKGHGLRQTS